MKSTFHKLNFRTGWRMYITRTNFIKQKWIAVLKIQDIDRCKSAKETKGETNTPENIISNSQSIPTLNSYQSKTLIKSCAKVQGTLF